MSLAKEELASIDLDVTEILNDYGSDELYVKPLIRSSEDDVYDEITFTEYGEPVKVKGLQKFEAPTKDNYGLGEKLNAITYTFKIQKSDYPNLTNKDLIVYKDKEYEILSLNASGVLGDDAIFHVVQAKLNGM